MVDRKINVEKLTDEQLEAAIASVSGKIGKITDKAITEANKLLARYGLVCKMQIAFEALTSESDTIESDQ
jgi:hypothetical protein